MPAKSFILANKADKELSKLPLQIQKKIFTACEAIKQKPVSGIKLQGKLREYFKFSVGDYRIVYSFDNLKSRVYIVKIEHRLGVYR